MTIRSTLLGIGAICWLAALTCWLRARGNGRLSREGVLFLLLGVPFLVAGGFFTTSSYPLEIAAASATPAPAVIAATPAPAAPAETPAPAPQTYAEAVAAAQRAAVARYPDLGRAGTVLNTRFIAAYRQLQSEDPSYFTDPEWPLHLADDLARAPEDPP